MNKTARIILSLATLGAIAQADAYRMIQNTAVGPVVAGGLVACDDAGGFAHWNTASMDWYHNTSGQGSGKDAALQAAVASWANVANSSYTPVYAGTTTAGFGVDGMNTLVWGAEPPCEGCLAITQLVLQAGQVIGESDVFFDSDFPWTTNGTPYDTQAVATHEIGHTLGIHHSQYSSSTMYAYYAPGWSSLEEDDNTAAQCAEARYLNPAGIPTFISGPFGVRTGTTYTVSFGPAESGTFARWEVQRHRQGTSWPSGVTSTTFNHMVFSSGSFNAVYEHRARACHLMFCGGWRTGAIVEVFGYQ